MKCRSGKHEWTDFEDAVRCCNGYHRELRTGTLGDKVYFRFVWVLDTPKEEEVPVRVIRK